MKPELNIEALIKEASVFAESESKHNEPSLFGVTDGKAVGTYLEHKFFDYLENIYTYQPGNSASGIDFQTLRQA